MGKSRHKKKSKLGLAPGSAVFTGEQKMEQVECQMLQYNQESVQEVSFDFRQDIAGFSTKFDGITWLNIDGLHDVQFIEQLCEQIGVHRLSLEDILSIGQRPKVDEHNEYLYLVLKMFMYHQSTTNIEHEQISFILKGKLLISFQERKGDVFDHVRKRIFEGKGRIRQRKADYLLYALVDSIVDYYFVILENLGETLEDVEIELLENPSEKSLSRVHAIRKELLHLRRSVYPLRELVSKLEKLPADIIEAENIMYIRDLYDHTIQIIESVEVFRDMTSGMIDLYMNSLSNRMNNVMKVLTIIATIFIPLTFIAGIYGMNFEYMPELGWKYGYFGIMTIMLVLALGMLAYFKKKKWM